MLPFWRLFYFSEMEEMNKMKARETEREIDVFNL
jgi:hypothetical protein